jgi:hypothetical protein
MDLICVTVRVPTMVPHGILDDDDDNDGDDCACVSIIMLLLLNSQHRNFQAIIAVVFRSLALDMLGLVCLESNDFSQTDGLILYSSSMVVSILDLMQDWNFPNCGKRQNLMSSPKRFPLGTFCEARLPVVICPSIRIRFGHSIPCWGLAGTYRTVPVPGTVRYLIRLLRRQTVFFSSFCPYGNLTRFSVLHIWDSFVGKGNVFFT